MNELLDGLRRLDLNLLVVFDALMRTRSVTRAAAQCHLSQPATSNALARLREALGDPLLVRTARTMRPSPRALALEGPLHALLTQLEAQLRPVAPFDPARTERTFRLALTDYGESVVLPPLVERLARHAPGAALEAVPLGPELPERALERGELDGVVAVQEYFQVPARLRVLSFLGDRLVCVGRAAAYPGPALTLKQFLAARHIYPAPLGVQTNVVESWLAVQGKRRRIAVTTQGYFTAARLAARSDLLLSLPSRIARPLVHLLPLRLLEPPRGFPRFRLCLIRHPLHAADGAVNWLLEQLVALGAELEEEAAAAPGG